jgi:hypothetical protein
MLYVNSRSGRPENHQRTLAKMIEKILATFPQNARRRLSEKKLAMRFMSELGQQ